MLFPKALFAHRGAEWRPSLGIIFIPALAALAALAACLPGWPFSRA